MHNAAFLKGYLYKEAFVGALAKGAPGFVANMVPAASIDIIGGKMQDSNIEEYRENLGLPPEGEVVAEADAENNTQKKLQDEATAGSVSITT